MAEMRARSEEHLDQDEHRSSQLAQRRSGAMMPHQPRSSGGGAGAGLILLALVFVVGPIILSQFPGVPLPGMSLVMLMGFGVLLLIIGLVVVTVTRLYHRAPADMAFVRTGMGGAKVVQDGGALVVPVVHEVIWLSLRTIRFEVVRSGLDALLTRDNLRADITAEFFVKIPKDAEQVLKAAQTFGSNATTDGGLREILEKKLESAIRGVAARMTLEELLRSRDEFIKNISDHARGDVEINGLVLESVTISRLDQTPPNELRPEGNIFDAQGARMAAGIITEAAVERRKIELEGQRRMEEETTRANEAIARQKVAQAQAEAARDRDIAIQRAMAEQESSSQAAEQQRLARLAEVSRDQAVELARVAQAQATAVANQERERATRTAEIAKTQATEVADREREVAVATAEQKRAQAEAQRLQAEAERAKREQEVQTVQALATADRQKQQAVIAATAEAEQRRVAQQVEADVAAYAQVKSAEAEREAADRRAAARLTQARADQESRVLEAEGQRAIELVPVQVAREQVAVETARTEVERQRLENQAAHETIARGLQVDLARIEADKEVRVAAAEAMGLALSSAKITVWGDPGAVERITRSFMAGQELAQGIDGFLTSAPDGFKQSVADLTEAVIKVLDQRGIPVPRETVREVIAEATTQAQTGAGNGRPAENRPPGRK